ncbi:MAG: late competence development ComFB family protein [Candidatus Sericytochromatia bacterium]|nr:late competence development ComFB family protein [Candidatus Sericytochromatia bacterium]
MFDKPLDQWPELNNFNERAVIQQLEAYSAEGAIPCECRECMLDVIALSLNSLPSRYAVSLLQKFYETPGEERTFRAEIKAAVDRAAAKVRLQPHH